MATSPDITVLLAKLVSHLETFNNEGGQSHGESSPHYFVSKVTESLNLRYGADVRVADAALSIMCFRSPEVFESLVEYLVRTIVAILSSSVSCKTFRLQNEEILKIGSSILCRDWVKLADMSSNAIRKLETNGSLARSLLYAVARLIVSTSNYEYKLPHGPVCVVNSIHGRSTAIAVLRRYLPAEIFPDDHEVPLRLLFWYLDPVLLKNDIGNILQDICQRPFLHLEKELYERVDWRSIVVSLALSPTMFLEARALLHNWFLMKGLASIMELLTGLVSVIRKIISTPTSWGIPMKLASKLPFTNAYFASEFHLLRIFSGPLSSEGLVHLVHALSEHSERKVAAVHHKSYWSLALNFPEWFYFSSALLFLRGMSKEECQLKCSVNATYAGLSHGLPSKAASRYIGWFLIPTDTSVQNILAKYLDGISEVWSRQLFGSGSGYDERSQGKKNGFNLSESYGHKMIEMWLQDFENSCVQPIFSRTSMAGEAADINDFRPQYGVLVRRVPLGIMICWPSVMTGRGCEMLLHYAATGQIVSLNPAKNTVARQKKKNFAEKEDSALPTNEWTKEEALAGACMVFRLSDAVESMRVCFETEEKDLEFVCHLKVKCGEYLARCINRIIQCHSKEGSGMLLIDLRNRLRQWRQLGWEMLHINEVFDDIDARLS